ncbi:hypothetical protein ACFX1T_018992 [Malus domestica]
MGVDTNLFLMTTINMVYARVPGDKGKGKAEFVPMQYVPKQNSQPRLKIDLFSNKPPKDFWGPAIVEPMSDFSVEEADGPVVLCSRCKADVIFIEPKEKPPQATKQRLPPMAVTTP